MQKFLKQILILFSLIAVLVLPYFVFADNTALESLEGVQQGSGYQTASETTISSIAAAAIEIFLGLLGIIFIILTLYGGYLYMTARGDEEKVEKGIATIRHAIIGLIIIATAYAITYFVFNSII